VVYLGGFWCALVTPDTAAPSYGLDADETPVEPQAQHATHGLRIGFNVKRDVLQAGATAADKGAVVLAGSEVYCWVASRRNCCIWRRVPASSSVNAAKNQGFQSRSKPSAFALVWSALRRASLIARL